MGIVVFYYHYCYLHFGLVVKVEAALRSGVLSSPPSPKAGAMPVESAPPEPDLVAEAVPDADGDAVALPLKGVAAPQGWSALENGQYCIQMQ
jgi:hypothetical protein